MITRKSLQNLRKKVNSKILHLHVFAVEDNIFFENSIEIYVISVLFLNKTFWFSQFPPQKQLLLKKNLWKTCLQEFATTDLAFQDISRLEEKLVSDIHFLSDFYKLLLKDSTRLTNLDIKVSDPSQQPLNDQNWIQTIGKEPQIQDIFELHSILQHLRYDISLGRSEMQKKTGAFFTPISVIAYILQSIRQNLIATLEMQKKIRIMDYSCGMGGFLLISSLYIKNLQSNLKIQKKKFTIEYWGVDIDPFALNIASFSMKLLENHQLFKGGMDSIIFLNQDSLMPLKDENIVIKTTSQEKIPHLVPYREEFVDFILSNPPYVSWGLGRVGKLDSVKEKYYRQTFSHSAEYKISYYAMFIERAIQLLKIKGTVALIIPDSFLMGKYFRKIRSYLVHSTAIQEIALFQRNFWTRADSGLPVILIFRKDAHDHKNLLMISRQLQFSSTEISILNEYQMDPNSFSQLSESRFRLLFSEESERFIYQFEQNALPLGDFFEIHHGIRSKKGIGKDKITSKICHNSSWKPGLISGKDVEAFKLSYQGDYINIDPENLYSGGYRSNHIEQEKIILRRTGDHLISAVDSLGYYHTNTLLYIIPREQTKSLISLHELCAILNSQVLNRYYGLISLKTNRTMPQVEIDMLNKIPLKLDAIKSCEIIQNVKILQSLKSKIDLSVADKQQISKLEILLEISIRNWYLRKK